MSDPISYGLLVAAVLIVGIVAILLFTRSPERRAAPPGMGSALLALADMDRAEARRILTDAVRETESSPESFLVLGRLLREDGEAERAMGLHRALLARPTLSPADRLAGELEFVRDLLALGRYDEALERVEDLETHFRDARLLDLHARALLLAGRMESAAEVWMKGARASRDEQLRERGARFISEVAREYLRLGQPETAERWARQSEKIDDGISLAHVVLGDVERGRGHDREARSHYDRALHLGGARWVLPRLIDHSHEQGQIDRLIDALEPVREAHPDDPYLARAVLDLRLRRGERDEFFAVLEADDVPGFGDPAIWAGWIRHLVAAQDEVGLARILSTLPTAFDLKTWACRQCGAQDHEPRAVCLACGAPEPLEPTTPGERT
jgi:tetratricopeptide (TPR) repeat protein